MINEIVLASDNPGKLQELQELLSPIICISQNTLGIVSAEETGLSFIENALIKARHASKLSNKPALSDDSGLVVPVLNGQPGIYSARFAGSHATSIDNMALLLKKMVAIPDADRYAYFYCAIVLVKSYDDPTPFVATGECHGFINKAQSGSRGFGYDPVFYLPEYQRTFAELPTDIKNTISHRAIALNKIRKAIFKTVS